jgi:hypothetical protein
MVQRIDFRGMWQSSYVYPSGSKVRRSEHFMKASVEGDRVTMRSVPDETGSIVTVDLLIEGPIATGAWRERTSPSGSYAGKEYFGAIQLWVLDGGQVMRGKWVGFSSKPGEIKSGEWEFTRSEPLGRAIA